jgi:hypothetical protein
MNYSSSPNDPQAISAINFKPSVDNIDDGYTLCANGSLTVVYSNATFLKWFNSAELHMSIADIIPSLKTDILLKRLDKRGYYLLVLETAEKKWGFPQRIEISFKLINVKNEKYIALHARDMTKLLEKETQVYGHTRLIEESNRELSKLNQQLQTENARLNMEVKKVRK